MQSLTRRLETAPALPWPADPVPIALVITDLDVGGAERTLVRLATALDRRRWNPSVIALGPEGKLVEPLQASGVATWCLGVDRRRPLRAVFQLARVLRRLEPRLVQSFLFHGNVAAKLAAPLAGNPWVLSGTRVAERARRWHLTLERTTAHLALGSVCVSQGVLGFSRDVGGASPDRLTVIPNGVDLEPYDNAPTLARASIGVPEEAHLALYVGRLDVQKGLGLLLEAAERVVAARADWHLVLVGDGPERESLQRRAAAVPALAGRVHRLGRRTHVPSLLKGADLLVLPSLWEGMPNVVLEAMAARRAVVATNVEGVGELVVPGETGWIVPAGDAEPLALALLEAAVSSSRRDQYGEAGRARVASCYSIPRMVLAYERLWARILGLALDQK